MSIQSFSTAFDAKGEIVYSYADAIEASECLVRIHSKYSRNSGESHSHYIVRIGHLSKNELENTSTELLASCVELSHYFYHELQTNRANAGLSSQGIRRVKSIVNLAVNIQDSSRSVLACSLSGTLYLASKKISYSLKEHFS